jgi:hypothetical protein
MWRWENIDDDYDAVRDGGTSGSVFSVILIIPGYWIADVSA